MKKLIILIILLLFLFFPTYLVASEIKLNPDLIIGIKDDKSYNKSNFTFTASIYRKSNDIASEDFITYMPSSWQVVKNNEVVNNGNWNNSSSPYEVNFTLSQKGEYKLIVTYDKYNYGQDSWLLTGDTVDIEINFMVKKVTAPNDYSSNFSPNWAIIFILLIILSFVIMGIIVIFFNIIKR